MFGFSIFLGEPVTKQTEDYIQEMKRCGFEGIFTSLQIPEENHLLYEQRLKKLGTLAKTYGLKLMVDISANALKQAGFSLNNCTDIKKIGVTGLRMDYGIPMNEIAAASHYLDIGLNTSTLTSEDIQALQIGQADFSRCEAWHNYYPRPETGLSSSFFLAKNTQLKAAGFTIVSFISGNQNLRGPICAGLPTLEKHRGMTPLAAALDLIANFQVAHVYVGDPALSEWTKQQFLAYTQKNVIQLAVNDCGSKYYTTILGLHTNRLDEAQDVIRSVESRLANKDEIVPEPSQKRMAGSVTMDNRLYGRYMGEIQLLKKDLPIDERVNVVGKIVAKDCELIKQIHGGQKFELVEKRKREEWI